MKNIKNKKNLNAVFRYVLMLKHILLSSASDRRYVSDSMEYLMSACIGIKCLLFLLLLLRDAVWARIFFYFPVRIVHNYNAIHFVDETTDAFSSFTI